MNLLHPCYDSKAALAVMKATPKGKERNVWLILNPDSGPGIGRDEGTVTALREAFRRSFRVAFYVDLIGGGDYSPFIATDGVRFTKKAARKSRVKAPGELRVERDAWRALYGKPDAWFFDDVLPLHPALIAELCNFPGTHILNPGCAFAPPNALSDSVVVISENAKGWPRKLTEWESKHKQQCAVMGLKVSPTNLPAFLGSTDDLGFRFASPLDDNWKAGQTAYATASPYIQQLL